MELPTYLRSRLINLGAKYDSLMREKDSLETLALGSSHGDFGFNPAHCPESFNLCCHSQDLKHSYLLYEKHAEECPSLKNVVLFYSVFSSGSELEKIPTELHISPVLNKIFDLGIQYKDKKLLEYVNLLKTIDAININTLGAKGFHSGFFEVRHKDGYLLDSYGAVNRAQGHVKYNKRTASLKYLRKILTHAAMMKHRVFIVIPPARSDYVAALRYDNETLFQPMMNIIKEQPDASAIKVIDYLGHPDFKDEYFGDFDHLLSDGAGAVLLSKMIYDEINKTYF